MRILAIAVAGAVALAPSGARADQREELQARGEEQAKNGRYAQAIDSFKAADRLQPRASHACLISLAYTRRELWSQAQLWLATCHERASADDPLPEWVPLAEKQIQERLQTANVAPVTITVKPEGTKAKVTVSSFAPDEVFEPRTITLPFGTHVIFAQQDGVDGSPRQYTLQITDKTPKRIEIDFESVSAPAPSDGSPMPVMPEQPAAPSNTASNALLIGGGIALIGGGVSHFLMFRAARQMRDATSAYEDGSITFAQASADYGDAEKRFDRWRPVAIGLYVVGAGAAITGYLIRKKHNPEAATIGAVPLPEGGAFVSVGWAR